MKIELNIELLVGEINYNNLESGYWLLKEGNNKYLIINIPPELKEEGLKITCIARVVNDDFSIYMTSNAISIVEFKLI